MASEKIITPAKVPGIGHAALVAAGLLCGWFVLQVLNMGWIVALVVLMALFLPLIGLNGYRAWVLMLIAATFSFYRYDAGGITLRLEHVALIMMMIGWLPGLLAGKNRLHRVPLLIPMAGLLGLNFLSSALYAPDRNASYQGAALLGVYMLMYVFSALVLQDHPEKLKSAVRFMLVLGVVQAVYGLVSLAANYGGMDFGGVNLRHMHVEEAVSIQGGFEEPNLFAAFAAVITLMFVALLSGGAGVIRLGRAAAGLGIMIISLLLAYTRAAWLGFIIGLFMLMMIQKPPKTLFNQRTVLIASMLLLTVILVAIPVANEISADTVGGRISDILNFSSSSAEGRVEVQRAALERWQSAVLLGHGTLSLPAIPPAGSWIYSSFLQVLHDTGIFGLFFLLWFQIGVLMITLKGFRQAKDPFFRAALAGLAAGSVALMIASQASSFIWLGFPWIYAGLCVAVASVARRDDDKGKPGVAERISP